MRGIQALEMQTGSGGTSAPLRETARMMSGEPIDTQRCSDHIFVKIEPLARNIAMSCTGHCWSAVGGTSTGGSDVEIVVDDFFGTL